MSRRPDGAGGTGGTDFNGLPEDALVFLKELEENNTKEWFEAHRSRFVESVQRPGVALVECLGARLADKFPHIAYDTRTNGSGSLMRIHRDVRFSGDKRPYKTNIAMMFVPAGAKKMEAPGFGLQIGRTSIDLVCGIFQFTKQRLEGYRAAVLDDDSGKALEEVVASVSAAGSYSIGGQTLKRAPRGFPTDHPRGRWLRHTGLYLHPRQIAVEEALSPAVVDKIMEHFIGMAPIEQWLRQWVYR